LARADDSTQSLEFRARSYLAVNCAICHHPGGPGQGEFDARISTPTSAAHLINGLLLKNGGDIENRVILPGSPDRSMILTRMSQRGNTQMPPISSNLVDTNGVALLRQWISQDLPQYRTYAQWQTEQFGSTNAPGSGVQDDPDGDGASNEQEFLTAHNPQDTADFWKISIEREADSIMLLFARLANRAFQVQSTTNLLDPASWSPLESPDNRFFFAATNSAPILRDALTNSITRFYRVEIIEP